MPTELPPSMDQELKVLAWTDQVAENWECSWLGSWDLGSVVRIVTGLFVKAEFNRPTTQSTVTRNGLPSPRRHISVMLCMAHTVQGCAQTHLPDISTRASYNRGLVFVRYCPGLRAHMEDQPFTYTALNNKHVATHQCQPLEHPHTHL